MDRVWPRGADYILETLNRAGYEAFLVGGCVRDILRGSQPRDWDICTGALPGRTAALFPRCVPTGLAHGTVTVACPDGAYEVTTFRADGPYSDGRRPDGVTFVSRLEEDLARRDFTVNAMAMDREGRLRDPFGGAADLRAGVLRCVGEPDRRFREDGLRLMRALRFAAVLDLAVESGTARSVHENRDMLRHVAAERLQAELRAMLPGPGAGRVLREFGDVPAVFWPELAAMFGLDQRSVWHCHDVWGHTVFAVEHAPADETVRLAALLHDVGKPPCLSVDAAGAGHFYGHAAVGAELAEGMLRRLRFPRALCAQVTELVARHELELRPEPKCLQRWLGRLGEEQFFRLLALKRSDTLAHAPACTKPRLERLAQIEAMARELIAGEGCFTLKDLAVDGRDALSAGIAPGPAVGAALRALWEGVTAGALSNRREVLLRRLEELAREGQKEP